MRVLVACVGNIFLGDDGFGTAVAAELARRELPEGVRLHDYGISSVHLLYDLLDGYDLLVLVDTVARQEGPPGTLYLIEPEVVGREPAPAIDPHDLPPGGAVELVALLGGQVRRILVVGVQPERLEEGIGLSAPVQEAVGAAADMVHDVVAGAVGEVKTWSRS
jgi:hydrogenase maturation protease